MVQHYHPVIGDVAQVLTLEKMKRDELRGKKPRVYEKIQRLDQNAHLGVISPTIRLCWNYLCNFECDHCCAEERMPRHEQRLIKLGSAPDTRRRMNYEDLARIAQEFDEYGIYRFVLTGGEPTTWPDLTRVIEVLDPNRHLVIMDSNAYLLAERRGSVQQLAEAGVYKMQISLDSYVEEEHDLFRKKKGSYRRVMQVLPEIVKTGMKLLVSTCLTKGRAFTQEFEDLCKYCTHELGAMLYVTYAKPTGTCGAHEDWKQWVIDKQDADRIRELELRYDITTHMTPSYKREKTVGSSALGHYDGCITVKGINTLEPWGHVVPCPYMDVAIGNVFEDSIAAILERGMLIRELGSQRKDCLIGEDVDFMDRHKAAVGRWQREKSPYLPVPWGEFWSEKDLIQIQT